MNRISVLWFEDRHNEEKWKGFKILAKKAGIDLYAYENMKDGLDAIKKNPDKYDVILLDANFHESQDNKVTDELYSIKTRDFILQNINKDYEFFVYTGEEKTKRDSTYHKFFTDDEGKKRIFYKGDDEEIDRLFEALINSAKRQPMMEIKSAYSEEFLAYSSSNLGLERVDLFLKVAKFLSGKIDDISKSDIRMIVEDILKSFIKLGLLSENIFKTRGSLTKSIYFIRGEHSYYIFHSPYKSRLHDSIAPALELLIKSCNADSHISSDTQYFSEKTLAKVLFNTLSALAKSYDQIKNIKENKGTWQPRYIVGKIEKRNDDFIFIYSGGEVGLEDHLKSKYYDKDKDYMLFKTEGKTRKTRIEQLY